MDWGQFDLEGAMRQRYLEIEDRSHDVRDYLHRARIRADDFFEMCDISWLYHENGLEGIVLSYAEIKSAVDNKIISDVSLIPTYRDIKHQKMCMDTFRDAARDPKGAITTKMMLELHKTMCDGRSDDLAFRLEIPIHRTYFHDILPAPHIAAALDEVLKTLNAKREADVHPIELAANVHHQFMRVFPFNATSGLFGRLLLNFVLLRDQLLPVIIHASDRQRYYEALKGPQRDFHGFIAEAMENSLENAWRFLRAHERGGLRASS